MGDENDFQNFQISPENYLGFEHDEYKNACYALAISNPTAYYALRTKVHKSIKNDALKALYTTFYNALTAGTDADGNSIIDPIAVPPAYPNQLASKQSLSACKTIMPVINATLEILLPLHGTQVAQKRMAELSLGKADAPRLL